MSRCACCRSRTSTSTTAAATSCATSSFEVPRGQGAPSLLGRNGVGKTTLLKCADGPAAGQTGSIELRRHADPPAPRRTQRARAGIGYVPQGREIFAPPHGRGEPAHGPGLQARRHADAGRAVRAVPGAEADAAAGAAAISRAASSSSSRSGARSPPSPKLLILDEPTEGIQPSIIKDIGRVIRMLADRGDMAILLVEQYYDFAARARRPLPRDGARRVHRARRRATWKPRACASWWRSELPGIGHPDIDFIRTRRDSSHRPAARNGGRQVPQRRPPRGADRLEQGQRRFDLGRQGSHHDYPRPWGRSAGDCSHALRGDCSVG